MDIRAHPISFATRPWKAVSTSRSRMRRSDRFSISSIQPADLGRNLSVFVAVDLSDPSWTFPRWFQSCSITPPPVRHAARDKALEGRKYIKITDATVRPFLHLLNPTRRPRQESFGFCRR